MFGTIMLLAAEPAGEYGKEEPAIFPIMDSQYFLPQLFWLGVTFAVLYFLLSRVFLPGVGQTLESRSSRIADDLDSASRMQREAEEAEAQHMRALADARAKAASVADATRASVDEEIAEQTERADAEAARAALVAEERIREIRTAAMSNVDAVARETADAIVAKLAGKPLKTKTAKAKA